MYLSSTVQFQKTSKIHVPLLELEKETELSSESEAFLCLWSC